MCVHACERVYMHRHGGGGTGRRGVKGNCGQDEEKI